MDNIQSPGTRANVVHNFGSGARVYMCERSFSMRRITILIFLFLSATLMVAQQNESAPPNRPADGQQSAERRGPRLGGTITAITSDTITLKSFEGRTVVVQVSDSTRYRKD